MQRIVVETRRIPHLHDLARVHHRRPVAHRRSKVQVVRDEENGESQLPAKVVQDGHHLGLGGHVERRRGFVCQDESRLSEKRRGDHDTLQKPAGQVVRILLKAALSVLDAHLGERVDRARPRLGLRDPMVGAQRLSHEVADAPHGVHVRARVLKDHRDLAAKRLQVVPAQRIHLAAVELHGALDRSSGREKKIDRACGHGLARAGFPHEAERLPRMDVEGDAVQHEPLLSLDRQPHRQLVDREQRRIGARPAGRVAIAMRH